MKKKICILGSTGSIGVSTLDIISKNKKLIKVELLSTNKNINLLYTQIKRFNVKNVIVNSEKSFFKFKKKIKNKKIKVYRSFSEYKKETKNRLKFDYTMSSISGIDGLKPTLEIIPFTKKIGIANKESIICGWNLISKLLKKYNVKFIPVDSEHFSIWKLIQKNKKETINKIFLTASGGPFLHWPLDKIDYAKPKEALKHPNWNMGKKISIDSATMMNKVFEIIEAQRIFDLPQNKFKILIHEKSYVHAIVEFNNGIIKILAHNTSMQIPIANSIFEDEKFKIQKDQINLDNLNNLNFKVIDSKKFSLVNILKIVPKKISLLETALVSINDELVSMYLKNKITFKEIRSNLNKMLNLNEIRKLSYKTPKNINEIINLDNYVRLKTRELCI